MAAANKPKTAWVTRGKCVICPYTRRDRTLFCTSCRMGICDRCSQSRTCPFCGHEEKYQSVEQMWKSVVMMAGLERWIGPDAWEDDSGQTIVPDPVAYKAAKDVLDEYWTIQQSHPELSFALPIVTLDVIGQGMFIDFRDDDKGVVCCYCDKKGEFAVSCRSNRREEKLASPATVASLLDTWIREHLFPSETTKKLPGNKE